MVKYSVLVAERITCSNT